MTSHLYVDPSAGWEIRFSRTSSGSLISLKPSGSTCPRSPMILPPASIVTSLRPAFRWQGTGFWMVCPEYIHPACATRHTEKLNSACRLASGECIGDMPDNDVKDAAVRTVMKPGTCVQSHDSSKSGNFICAVGGARHSVISEKPVHRIQSTRVSGLQDRVCHSCFGSVPLYTRL
jgi:hypothetical protein